MSQRRVHLRLIIAVVAVAAIIAVNCGDENPNDPGNGDDNGGIVLNPVDTIPPAAVSSILVKLPRSSKLTLQWFAPGDGVVGQASRYDVLPPKPAGQPEQITAQHLPSHTEIHFALKTYDEVPNESALSVCVSEITTTLITKTRCRWWGSRRRSRVDLLTVFSWLVWKQGGTTTSP